MSLTSNPPHFLKSTFSRIELSGVKLPLILSLMNQFVSSGGNFLLGVYLARTLPLEGFGLYGIGYGICMLYIGLGNAVLLTQMVVNMPDKAPEDKERYAARMLYGVLILSAAVLLLAALVIGTAILIRPDFQRFILPMAAIAIASVLFLCNEFFISYAYMKRRETLALMVNLLTVLVLFAGLAIERKAGITLQAGHVLLIYALGAAVGSCVAYAVSPLKLLQAGRNLVPDFMEAWAHGRWAMGGVAVTWIQSQAYTYVLAFFLGPGGVGQATAARIFISPFSFLLPAINKVAIPRLADLRHHNPEKMARVSMMLTIGLSALTVIYALMLLTSLEFVTQFILGRQDARVESLVWVWCIVLVLQMVRSGGSVLMQVQRKFRILTLINIPSAIVTLIGAILLIRFYGAAGAIWGMVAGEIVLSLMIWREIAHDRINRS